MNNKNKNQAIILAAGVGSRLAPLTNSIPKPLAPILGIPVMEHIVNLCKKHGFTELCANTHIKADEMEKYFCEPEKNFGVSLNLVYEKDLTGVGGGIRSCKKYLTDQTVLIIMGDAITDADLSYLYKKHIENKCAITIGIMEIEDTSQFGVILTDENDKVISFQEKPSAQEAKSNLANTGIYLFDQAILKNMPSPSECPFYDVAKDLFPSVMSANIPIQAIKINGYWADIGTIKQYKTTLSDVIEGKVKIDTKAKKMPYGYLESSATVDKSVNILGKAYIGKNVQIKKGVVLKGAVFIEENAVIEENVVLENTVVWRNTKILKDSKISNSILANDCIVNEGSIISSNSVFAPYSTICSETEPAKTF